MAFAHLLLVLRPPPAPFPTNQIKPNSPTLPAAEQPTLVIVRPPLRRSSPASRKSTSRNPDTTPIAVSSRARCTVPPEGLHDVHDVGTRDTCCMEHCQYLAIAAAPPLLRVSPRPAAGAVSHTPQPSTAEHGSRTGCENATEAPSPSRVKRTGILERAAASNVPFRQRCRCLCAEKLH